LTLERMVCSQSLRVKMFKVLPPALAAAASGVCALLGLGMNDINLSKYTFAWSRGDSCAAARTGKASRERVEKRMIARSGEAVGLIDEEESEFEEKATATRLP